MNWTYLSPDEAEAFINAVKHPDHIIMFEPSLCDVYSLPLPFYDGYTLMRISNKNMIPPLVLDFLSDGTNHYYLDGSDSAFHNVNAHDALTLSADNVTLYLDMYISYVYERGNSLHVPRNAAPMTAQPRADGPGFTTHAPLLYHGKTIDSVIHIDPRGAITIEKPFNVTYLSNPQPGPPISYTHPRQEDILQQCALLLQDSPTGAGLIKLMQDKNVTVRVLPSPSYQGFITNDPIAYICMPAVEQTAKYIQALCLAGALRDVEHILGTYYHPHPNDPEELYLKINTGKNLDMAVELCKIVKELDDIGIEAHNDLRMLGLGPLYAGFKAGKNMEQLYDIYAQIMIDEGMIVTEE